LNNHFGNWQSALRRIFKQFKLINDLNDVIHKQCFFDTDMVKVVTENFSGYAVPVLYFFSRQRNRRHRSWSTVDEYYKIFRYGQMTRYCIVLKNSKYSKLQVTQTYRNWAIARKVTKGYTKETMTTVDNVQYSSGSQSPSVRNRESRTFRKESKIIYHQRFHCRRQYLLLLYYKIQYSTSVRCYTLCSCRSAGLWYTRVRV